MHPAAIALFATLGTANLSQPSLVRAQAGPACVATMDPLFVRHVPPATRAGGGNPLLWLIGSSPNAAGTAAPDEQDCVRPIQVRNGR